MATPAPSAKPRPTAPREAELLYVRQDPGFGEALQDLRGRGDGWASYLTALDCLLHEREGEARKFLQHALNQESNGRLKMSWLRQAARRSPESLRSCIDQARLLQRAQPKDEELQVGWLEIQGYEASERGLFDLAANWNCLGTRFTRWPARPLGILDRTPDATRWHKVTSSS